MEKMSFLPLDVSVKKMLLALDENNVVSFGGMVWRIK